jgi:hypothetical protein
MSKKAARKSRSKKQRVGCDIAGLYRTVLAQVLVEVPYYKEEHKLSRAYKRTGEVGPVLVHENGTRYDLGSPQGRRALSEYCVQVVMCQALSDPQSKKGKKPDKANWWSAARIWQALQAI